MSNGDRRTYSYMAIRIKREIRMEYWNSSDEGHGQIHSVSRLSGRATEPERGGEKVHLGELTGEP